MTRIGDKAVLLLVVVGLCALMFVPRCVAQSATVGTQPAGSQAAREPGASKQSNAESQAPAAVAQPAPPKSLPNSPGEIKREVTEVVMAQPPCRVMMGPCDLSAREKFQIFARRSYSPYTFAGALFDSAYSHLLDEKYGPGVEGYAKRYGATLADGEFRSFFQTFVFSSAFHQDPRYFRLGEGNTFYRMAYAGSRVFVGRTDDGRSTFNSPEMLGVVTTSAFSNLYQPERDRGARETFGRALSALGSDASTNLLREFW